MRTAKSNVRLQISTGRSSAFIFFITLILLFSLDLGFPPFLLLPFSFLLLPFYPLQAVDVRPQCLRDYYRPISLLIVFEQRQPQPSNREPRPIQRVREFRLRLFFAAKSDARPPRLKRFAVRTRRDLSIGVLAWQPDFDVIGLGGRESKVAGGQCNSSISQPKLFKHHFGVMRQRLQFIVRVLGPSDLHKLDFVELMLANQPSSVFAVASRFGPEARRIRGHLDRQARAVEDFVRVDVRQRDFGGRDQIESTLVG